MKNLLKVFVIINILASCGGIEGINTDNDSTEVKTKIEESDWENTAHKAVNSMISSGAISNPNGKKYVIKVSEIKNNTSWKIDTNDLTRQIKSQLLKNGNVAVADEANSNDNKTNVLTPDFSLSGNLIRKTPKIVDKEKFEYYIKLNLTDINTGLDLWENETPVIKQDK